MIISASRRTDVPAFYSDWFMKRIEAGHCEVPNPFNPNQVSRVSLQPEDVDVFVFWTRNASPLLPHLNELELRGYRYTFLYTVMNNPRSWTQVSLLGGRAGDVQSPFGPHCPERVIWRYDPLSTVMQRTRNST